MDNWLNQNKGEVQLNPDPPHGINGQCVNAASSWSMYQGGPELFGNGDDSTAWSIWETFNSPFYQRVTSGFQSGDILCYRPNDPAVGTGSAGHIDVYLGNGQTADADWNGESQLQVLDLNLQNHAVGAFRPINQGDDEVHKPNETDVRNFFARALAGEPTQDQINTYVNQSIEVLYNDLLNYDITMINDLKKQLANQPAPDPLPVPPTPVNPDHTAIVDLQQRVGLLETIVQKLKDLWNNLHSKNKL